VAAQYRVGTTTSFIIHYADWQAAGVGSHLFEMGDPRRGSLGIAAIHSPNAVSSQPPLQQADFD